VVLDAADFTTADQGTGRRLTLGAPQAATANASGTVDHVALCTGSTLLYVTTCAPVAVVSGGTITLNAAMTIDMPQVV
jgi:hypothetical protein